MLRGELFQAKFDPIIGPEQSGKRPVLIVSRNALNANLPRVIVVPLTGRENKTLLYPTHVVLRAGDGGLAKDSIALCEQVRAVSKSRLKRRIGQIGPQALSLVDAKLKIALDLAP